MSEEAIDFLKYKNSFLSGYRNNAFSDERVESSEELTGIESLAYDDGCNYAEYCKIVGTNLSTTNEQLEAEIDKCHTSALNRIKNGKHCK